MANEIKLNWSDKQELYELYKSLSEAITDIHRLIRNTKGYEAAKAYWYANLSQGLSDSEYCTNNPTFESYLKDHGIIDDNGEFIDMEDENEEDPMPVSVPFSDLLSYEQSDMIKREMKHFGLNAIEARQLLEHPKYFEIKEKHDIWMKKNGLTACDSPLSRGYLLDLIKEK